MRKQRQVDNQATKEARADILKTIEKKLLPKKKHLRNTLK